MRYQIAIVRPTACTPASLRAPIERASRVLLIWTGSLVRWLAPVAAPASAADVGHGCVGSAVASVADFTQEDLGEGFGAYFHSVDQIPGDSIQAHAAQFCARP